VQIGDETEIGYKLFCALETFYVRDEFTDLNRINKLAFSHLAAPRLNSR
jgi:hypothetical protein